MNKPKPFRMIITKNQLREIAIQSISTRQNLSDFWSYVESAQKSNLLNMTTLQVKNWLSTQEDLIYGLGFKREDEAKSLSSSIEYKEIIPNRSGIIEMPPGAQADNNLQKDPQAESKSLALVVDIAKRYGWTCTGINKEGNPTIFHHAGLDLHVYAHYRPLLQVTGTDGIRRPCLQYESFMQDTPYKGDAVASLLVTCACSPVMAKHIEGFCPGYLSRWSRYQSILRSKRNG